MIGIILANNVERTDLSGSSTTKLRAEQEEASCTHATWRGFDWSCELPLLLACNIAPMPAIRRLSFSVCGLCALVVRGKRKL
jgi:hypothetical protein